MTQAQKEWKDLRNYVIDTYVRAPDSETDVAILDNVRAIAAAIMEK